MFEQGQDEPDMMQVPQYMPQVGESIQLPNDKDERKDIITVLLQLKVILQELENNIRGYEEVPDEKTGGMKWEKPEDAEPLVNELGLRSLMFPVKSIMNANVVCSSFSDDEVREWTLWVHDSVCDLLFKKYQEFGIDKSNLSLIVLMIETIVKTTLNRAKDGMSLQTIGNIAQVRETNTIQTQMMPMQPQQGKIGLMDRLKWNPFGGR